MRADLGGRVARAWARERSTLDLLEPGLTLFASRDEDGWEAVAARLGEGAPVAVRRLEPVTARGLGAPAGSALLVRSDGTPVGVLRAAEASAALPLAA